VPETPRDEASQSASRRFLPRLALTEWIVFCALAAALSIGNLYSTLLTGWSDAGSIIAVIGAVLFLGLMGRRKAGVQHLNLGQTLASAGGTAGFAVSAYAAVRMADSSFAPDPLELTVLFLALSAIGVLYGATLRRALVRYYFPTGTACAVILRSVSAGGAAVRRQVRTLARWGAVSAVLAVPTKISLQKGAGALFSAIPLGTVGARPLSLAVDPLLYGLGLVVGLRIGVGMFAGALAAIFVVPPLLTRGGVPEAAHGDWITWLVISLLVLPTFAGVLFARLFRAAPLVPAGFEPGKTVHPRPRGSNWIGTTLLAVAALVAVLAGGLVFGLPWHLAVLAIAITWPLAMINGRVTADTDINPALLAVFATLTLATVTYGASAVLLLGVAVICQTLAGLAVDLLQDYRTGYLVDANPTHQTSVQLIGAFIGVLVAVPCVLLLDARLGFGPDAGLPAPGPRIYTGMAEALAGTGVHMSSGLVTTIVVASLAGVVYTFFSNWPRTKRWMPSLFGAGIGMLLGFDMTAAVFVGALAKWIVAVAYRRRARARGDRDAATDADATADADATTTLIGSAVFASSALTSVLVILAAAAVAKLGLDWFYMAF